MYACNNRIVNHISIWLERELTNCHDIHLIYTSLSNPAPMPNFHHHSLHSSLPQERYHSLAPMYYRGAQAAIVVYDITNADTFARAKNWVKELQRQVLFFDL